MASFRPLGQFIQFFLDDGTVNAGGSITFYETDLTTLKDTYSDPDLTVLNSNPVTLDAAGRPSTDIWGSGVYGAVLADTSGTTIQTLNNIQSGADPGLAIPALVAGEFLSNDASNLLWEEVLQVPDPTGSNGQVVSTDGTLVFWRTLAQLGIPASTIADGSYQLGTMLIQTGTGTATASGTTTTAATVTFPIAYASTPFAFAVPTNTGLNNSWVPVVMSQTIGTSSATFLFDSNSGFPGQGNFTSTQNFRWLAIGVTA